MSVTRKVLRALQNGRALTKQNVANLGAANPSATIAYIRNLGYDVVSVNTGRRVRSTGQFKRVYELAA